MTLQTTKDQLIQLLEDEDNRVIALSGKWGTGKSHLWREVKEASGDDAVKSALYVSLFGLNEMSQVKLKIVQSALPSAGKNSALWERVRVSAEGAKKILTSIHKGFSALDDIALLAVPTILKDKVIVLDDIERKHDKLSIDEVLGFIDEFTQQYGARFIVILNSDQLHNKILWDTFREKVIDQELRLNTSSTEAFNIAINLTPSSEAERIRSIVEGCGITNIRIIRKVIKVVNNILRGRQGLTNAVLSRVIPSTVLLSAIHYKGIEAGPDFDFVLAQGTSRDWSILVDKNSIETDEDRQKLKWKLMLTELGILACDEYELVVIEYLESGLFDVSKVGTIIERYIAEADLMNTVDACNKFFEKSFWHYHLSDTELLSEAMDIVNKANLLDPYMATSLHDTLLQISGGENAAQVVIENWIAGFRKKNLQEAELDNFFRRNIHPLIEAEFHAVNAKAQANTSIFDACKYLANNSGWGYRQEAAMQSATVNDIEMIIRNSSIENLKLFLIKMLDLYVHKQTYQQHFGGAMDNFVSACRNILADQESGRLAKLIRHLFDSSKVGKALE